MSEKIMCSAIHYNDGFEYENEPVKTGFIILGRRHKDCNRTLNRVSFLQSRFLSTVIQGFMTDRNRFVDRNEAFTIAKNNNQIWHHIFDTGTDPEVGLTSEDIFMEDEYVTD